MLNDGDLRKENYGNDSKKFYAKGRSKIDALNAPETYFKRTIQWFIHHQ